MTNNETVILGIDFAASDETVIMWQRNFICNVCEKWHSVLGLTTKNRDAAQAAREHECSLVNFKQGYNIAAYKKHKNKAG